MDSNLDFLIVLSIHAFSNLKTRSGSLNKKRKGGQMGMSDDDTGDDFDTENAPFHNPNKEDDEISFGIYLQTDPFQRRLR